MDFDYDIKAAAKWLGLDLEETRMAVKMFAEESRENLVQCNKLAEELKYGDMNRILQAVAGTSAMLQLEQINRYALKIIEGAKEAKPNVVNNILPLLEKEIDELQQSTY